MASSSGGEHVLAHLRVLPSDGPGSIIARARMVNASSTPWPVFALVRTMRSAGASPAIEVVVERPLGGEIGLVEHEDERHASDRLPHLFVKIDGGVEGGAAGAIHDQHVAGRAAQVRQAERLVFVPPVDVPEHQFDVPVAQGDRLLVDLDADRRVVLVGEQAVDEPRHEARLADGKPADETDLVLDHGVRERHYRAAPNATQPVPLVSGVFSQIAVLDPDR